MVASICCACLARTLVVFTHRLHLIRTARKTWSVLAPDPRYCVDDVWLCCRHELVALRILSAPLNGSMVGRSRRRARLCALYFALLVVQLVNAIFYLAPNAYVLRGSCRWYSGLVDVSGFVRWNMWISACARCALMPCARVNCVLILARKPPAGAYPSVVDGLSCRMMLLAVAAHNNMPWTGNSAQGERYSCRVSQQLRAHGKCTQCADVKFDARSPADHTAMRIGDVDRHLG